MSSELSLQSADKYFNWKSEEFRKEIRSEEDVFRNFFKNYGMDLNLVKPNQTELKLNVKGSLLEDFLKKFKEKQSKHINRVACINFNYIKCVLDPYINFVSTQNYLSDKQGFLNVLSGVRNTHKTGFVSYDVRFIYCVCPNKKKEENSDKDNDLHTFSDSDAALLINKFFAHFQQAQILYKMVFQWTNVQLNVDQTFTIKKLIDDCHAEFKTVRSTERVIKITSNFKNVKLPEIPSFTTKWTCTVKPIQITIGDSSPIDMKAFETNVREYVTPSLPPVPTLMPGPQYPQPYYKQGLPPIHGVR